MTTGPGPLGHQIFAYHHAMIDLAKRALDEMPREERDISSLTLSVGEDTLPLLKQRLSELRQELLQLAEMESAPVRVIQLNMQLFPLSRRSVVSKTSELRAKTSEPRAKRNQKR